MFTRVILFITGSFLVWTRVPAQLHWVQDSALQAGLPDGIHVFKNQGSPDGKPFVAWYAQMNFRNLNLEMGADTTVGRRITPQQFYERLDSPLLVINGTFFSFATQQNLNAVMHRGRLLAYNQHSLRGTREDSLYYYHPFRAALGMSKNRKPDVAWLFTDSTRRYPYAFQSPRTALKNQNPGIKIQEVEPGINHCFSGNRKKGIQKRWKMQTAIGGGPVLIQDRQVRISSREERMFLNSEEVKHPRTAMGYTPDHLIILVIQGRFPGIAEGAGLGQVAALLKELGCIEAINLDGGGSSCMLINGKETIKPSDPAGQRAVPAVFYIRARVPGS
jgi:hypothetical protein